MSMLNVNCNQVDITPAEPVVLTGYANRKGMSSGVHRRLSSRCVAFSSGKEKACLIANDLLDIMPEMTEEIIASIAGQSGIPADRIFMHNIHTHSAAGMEYGLSEANDRYIPWAVERIVSNAVKTIKGTTAYQACSVRCGRARCDISANRRLIDPVTGLAEKVSNEQGTNDREVGILQIVDGAGKPVVTLMNFACHPVVLGFDSVVVSTDYPGAARETVERALGGMAIFLNGASGNINPCMTDQTDPAVADGEGTKLGNAVAQANLETWDGPIDIQVRSRTVQLPYRDQQMTAERFNREVERRLGDKTEFHNWPQDLRKWGDLMIDRARKGKVPDTCPIAVAEMSLGPAVFLLSQGEVFIDYQIRVKKAYTGKILFFVGYTNGLKGYIPTAEDFRHKGYEVDQAYVYMEEPSPLTPETETIYMNALNDLLREVS
jgi:hypothetical protein